MPNSDNVQAPVVIIGIGRSGTSLLSAMFERHPDFCYQGELANLIFGLWSSVEMSLNGMPELREEGQLVSPEKRAALVTRQALLSLLPSAQKQWCIKPIGIPRALTDRFPDEVEWDEAAEYYWKVLGQTFPGARYLTVLRHPCDVVLSSSARWGHDHRTMWWSLGFMAHILNHSSAPKFYPLPFGDLASHKGAVIQKMMSALRLPFRTEMLGAFAETHATHRDLKEFQDRQGSRQDQWTGLAAADLPFKYRAALDRLFKRSGQPPIEWPDHFSHRGKRNGESREKHAAPESMEGVIQRHLATIAALNRTVDRTNLHCESTLLEQSRMFDEVWREKEEYIRSLSDAITWHEAQTATLVGELESTQAKLVEATQYFEKQEAEARAEHDSLQKMLTELRAWNEELTRAKDWHDRQTTTLNEQLRDATRLAAEQKSWDEQQLSHARAANDALLTETQQLRDWNSELTKALEWHQAQNASLTGQLEDIRRLLEETRALSESTGTGSTGDIEELRTWNKSLVEAKEWHTNQIESLTKQFEDAVRLAAEQRDWHEKQLAHAQATTEAYRVESEKLRNWNAELVRANEWHADQLESHAKQLKEAQRFYADQRQWSENQLVAAQAETQQLKEWNNKLVEAKNWHTEQIEKLTTQLNESTRLAVEQRAWQDQQLAHALAAKEALQDEAEKLRMWNAELMQAKDWQAVQNENLAKQLLETVRLEAEQKAWHEQQLAHAHAATEAHREEITKLRDWNTELVKAKDWHEQQLGSARAANEALQAESVKLRAWNAELITAKDWQAAQTETLNGKLAEAARIINEQKQWYEQQVGSARAANEALQAESAKLRAWNAELAKAKDWQTAQTENVGAQLHDLARIAAAQKTWLEEQLTNARAAADAHRSEYDKLRTWNAELAKAVEWYASQRNAHDAQLQAMQRLREDERSHSEAQLAELHVVNRQLQAWIAELVEAKDWHAAQSDALASQLRDSTQLAAEQKDWHEHQLAHATAANDALQSEMRQLRDWNAELSKAVDWHAAQAKSLVERLSDADRIFREQQGWIAILESGRK